MNTTPVWDAEWQDELDDVESEIERARSIEPVSDDAGRRLVEYIGRLERIADRLRIRKQAATS